MRGTPDCVRNNHASSLVSDPLAKQKTPGNTKRGRRQMGAGPLSRCRLACGGDRAGEELIRARDRSQPVAIIEVNRRVGLEPRSGELHSFFSDCGRLTSSLHWRGRGTGQLLSNDSCSGVPFSRHRIPPGVTRALRGLMSRRFAGTTHAVNEMDLSDLSLFFPAGPRSVSRCR